MIIESVSSSMTFELGVKMGQMALPGQIISLIGDLGVGKTVFTQGFAKGLSIKESINSPTFTIIQEYHTGKLPFYHFDVYRIGDVSEMDEIGYEEYFYAKGVCIVEWANLIEELMPEETINVLIEKNLEKGFEYRRITVENNPLFDNGKED